MSSMLEQLWPVFLAEVSEKLETVESLIITAEHDNSNIDALFREFHTLKSSFSMVDFKVPMDLAHACEDVLHNVRKTQATPDSKISKYLLEAIDWIKQQLAIASPGQYPQQANNTLLEKLAPFRITEDENPEEENTIDTNINASLQDNTAKEKKESAAKKIAEDKESLAVDTLRINSYSLDSLVTHVSQLALKESALSNTIYDERISLALIQMRQILQQLKANGQTDKDQLKRLLDTFSEYRQILLQTDINIQTAISNIQQEVMDLRIIPLSTIFNRLPRIVRQKASAAGKKVQFNVEGGDVSIDKGMIEVMSEPLIHLLHDTVLHGIETTEERQNAGKPDTSQIRVAASEQGNLLRIEIIDDGYGRNSHDVELDTVRGQLSGIGGTIDVYAKPGISTRFVMRMPVTVAIQNAILVQTASQTFAIPARHLVEIIELPYKDLQSIHNQNAINLRGNMLPVYTLARILNLQKHHHTPSTLLLLILQNDNDCIALAIDDVLGRQELFLRTIHPDLRNIPGIGGVSLLGNGSAIIILDCANLFELAMKNPEFLGASHE